MIVSFVPGRIRLRFKELKNSAAAELAQSRIAGEPGITNVAINPVTGSILIEYDPKILPTEKLTETGRRELAKLHIDFDPRQYKTNTLPSE